MNDKGTPNSERLLRIIDISSVTRPFSSIKRLNVLIIVLGFYTPWILLAHLIKGELGELSLAFELLSACVLGFAALIAWKNINVLNAVIQPGTLTSLFMLAGLALAVFTVTLDPLITLGVEGVVKLKESEQMAILLQIFGLAWLALISMIAAISVIRLRRRRIKALKLTLRDFVRTMKPPSSRKVRKSLRPQNRARGWSLIAGGCALLLGEALVPDSIRYYSSEIAKAFSFIPGLSFGLFLGARSQFQPTCETLLANDKRPPVLLLRSFRDDEATNYARAESSFVDYSLESRIMAHFFSTGPFIAVGAPPQKNQPITIGAARATLADSKWQGKVMEWIDSSALIILFAGITSWIHWELKKVVESGHISKLILCFPQSKTKLFGKDKRYRSFKRITSARLDMIRTAFEGTVWEDQLSKLDKPKRIRSMFFEDNGRVTVVTARSRNRNTYHLAVLIAHFLLVRNRARLS